MWFFYDIRFWRISTVMEENVSDICWLRSKRSFGKSLLQNENTVSGRYHFWLSFVIKIQMTSTISVLKTASLRINIETEFNAIINLNNVFFFLLQTLNIIQISHLCRHLFLFGRLLYINYELKIISITFILYTLYNVAKFLTH